jgi:dihydrofolate synthase/folylpolyglutamate synthase
MNFQESVEYLYGLGHELSVKKFGLSNTFALLEALKNPEKKYLKVQVAGTNGKGSTCAFLSSICVTAGIKVGLNTSPHLVSITERIKINGKDITEEDFAQQATFIREISEKLVESGKLEALPTFFEQVTAISLNYFAEQNVEIAILETGLGGRFDATTAAKAEVVALTPIDYDHQKILGDTLTEIAAEKAAIIREDTKVIVSPQKNEVKKVINGRCREKGVKPIWATTKIQLKKQAEKQGISFLTANFNTEDDNYPNVALGLLGMSGRHQITNASTAIFIAEVIREFDFDLTRESILSGLETAEHRGRLEFYGNILFDGAHNVSGAKALREYLDEFVNQPITMIFGAMRDKDLSEISEILFLKAEKIILTKPANPRSMETEDLSKFVPKSFPKENVFVAESVENSIKKARKISAENDLILITGSLYLVGEAQKILKNESKI